MKHDFIPSAHWNFLTPLYETIFWPLTGSTWKRIAREASNVTQQGGSVIDLGCGPGTVLRLLRHQRPDLNLNGIDIDPVMIRYAKRKTNKLNITFTQASIDHLPFKDQSVDTVTCSFMFHHLSLDMKRKAISEAKRILKPNRPFLLCDLSMPNGPNSLVQPVRLWAFLEPEIIPQLNGQLIKIGKEADAKVQTPWATFGCVSLHILTFPN